MTDRPILFSGPMVQAILREIEAPGTGKTQTRRVIKLPRKTASGGPIYERKDMGGWEPTTNGGAGCFIVARDGTRRPAPETVGLWHRTTGVCLNTDKQAGDLLWVREGSADVHPLAVQEGRYSIIGQAGIPGPPLVKYRRVYRADGDVLQVWHSSKGYPFRSLEQEDELAGRNPTVCSEWVGRLKYQPWTPSIHMPRWASRLTLEVTGVKVERLQDISEHDALAEGVVWSNRWLGYVVPGVEHPNKDFPVLSRPTAREMYAALWDVINGPGAWAKNPYVAVVTFRPHPCNIDHLAVNPERKRA